MALDLTSLINAISSLEDSIDSYNVFSSKSDIDSKHINTIKAGVIQNFEVAYEQSWKFMKRWIEENVNPELVDGVTRNELFRVSAENKLIADVEEWMKFHKSRNLTSHTYDGENAEKVFQASMTFLAVSKDFLSRIEARNA